MSDGPGSLRSTLSIYDFNGLSIGSAVEDSSTLLETYTGTLAAGVYYAQVASFGGHAQVNDPALNFNNTSYFDTGSYFLTGSGFTAAAPEPGTAVLLIVGMLGFAARRQRPAAQRE